MSITKKNKERISISINPEILSQLDREVDGINISSRSEAIEKIISNYVSERKKCVILAGGNSDNLQIGNTFAPLTKINNKYLIEDTISKVKKAGYNDIIVIGDKNILAAIFKILGEQNITYIEEKEHKNTAKTLELAKSLLKSTFLFVPCDHYFEIDLKDMEKYHKLNKGLCTLAIYSGTEFEWKKSSIVTMSGNKIVNYVESPKYVDTHLTSLFIGFAEPEMFDFIPSAKISYSLQKDVFPELAKKEELYGYLYSGKWKNLH